MGYIRDRLFYGLRKHLHEAIRAKFDNPLNNYMAAMQAAHKAKGEHEQDEHDNSYCQYALKSGLATEAPMDGV